MTSRATWGPMIQAPMHITLTSSCSTALAGHEGVVADRGADAGDLVGGNAGPGAGAADEDDALDLAFADEGDRLAGDIRKVHRCVRVRSDVDDLVAVLREHVLDESLQQEPGVVVREADRRPAGTAIACGERDSSLDIRGPSDMLQPLDGLPYRGMTKGRPRFPAVNRDCPLDA